MPGIIHISATQPTVIMPLFLQVAVGKREYSGNIEQDDLSFPVTSLRESMVMMLYNADRKLISKSELKTKAIVESGTMDAVFTLDSGGKIILQVQFLLNDDDRKRIQEMRNSAMKRKQQEQLGDGNELNFPDTPLSKRLIEKISNIQSEGAERSKLRKSLSLDDLQERAVFSGINVDQQTKKASRDLLQTGVRDTLSLEDPSDSKKGNNTPESKSSSVKKMISTFDVTTPQGIVSETEVSSTRTDSGSTLTCKTVIPFDDHKSSNYRSEKTVSSQHTKTSEPVQTGMPKITGRSRRSETGVSPTPTDSGSTQAGKTIIPFDDHKASNDRSGKTVSSQHVNKSEPVQTGMPKTAESGKSCRSEAVVSPTPTDSGSTQAGKTIILFDDNEASNDKSGKTVSSQHINMSEPVQTGMSKTSESESKRSSETGVSPTPTNSSSTQACKIIIPFDDCEASNDKSRKTVSSQHINTSELVQIGMPKTTESGRSCRSETGVSPTPTDLGNTQSGKTVIPYDDHEASNDKSGKTGGRSCRSETGISPSPTDLGNTQSGKTVIPYDDHEASNDKSGKIVSSQHINMSEPVQTGMSKTIESERSYRSETGVSPTPSNSGSTQAGKTIIPFDDHWASKDRSWKTVSSQHINMSEPVQTGMPKTTESRRSSRSETGVSLTPTNSGSTQTGKTIIPFDDHEASNDRSEKTVFSQHINASEPVQTGTPKTTERRSCRSETDVSPTPTNSDSMLAGKTVMPFDDHKASTVSSQHIKMSAPVQTGLPKTTESKSRRSDSRYGASKQNLRENELIRRKKRPQAKHQRSIGPSYLAEEMHSRDYIERPLNYLVATSSTWIHPHVCVTSASKQLKDLLQLEHLNSLAHIQHTAQGHHVHKVTQENKNNKSIAAAQTPSSGFPVINGWLINQGVRAAIVVIACGAMFFNNR